MNPRPRGASALGPDRRRQPSRARTRRPRRPPASPAARLCKRGAATTRPPAGEGGEAAGAHPVTSRLSASGVISGVESARSARRAAHRSPEARAPSLTSLTPSCFQPRRARPPPGPASLRARQARAHSAPLGVLIGHPGPACLHKYLVPGHGSWRGPGKTAEPEASPLPSLTSPLRDSGPGSRTCRPTSLPSVFLEAPTRLPSSSLCGRAGQSPAP